MNGKITNEWKRTKGMRTHKLKAPELLQVVVGSLSFLFLLHYYISATVINMKSPTGYDSWGQNHELHSVLGSIFHSLGVICHCYLVAKLCPTLSLGAHQTSLSMWLPLLKYWSGLPFTSPGDLPEPGIKPGSPAWCVDSLPLRHPGNLTNKCFSIDYLMNEWDLCTEGFSGDSAVKNLPVNTGDEASPCNVKIPWRRKWWPTPVFLPGKSHGQRSLEWYSPTTV